MRRDGWRRRRNTGSSARMKKGGFKAMKKILALVAGVIVVSLAALPAQQPPQSWSGRLSDSMCGASHQAKAAAGSLTERECIFACIKGLAKYVLIDDNNHVIPIANQD